MDPRCRVVGRSGDRVCGRPARIEIRLYRGASLSAGGQPATDWLCACDLCADYMQRYAEESGLFFSSDANLTTTMQISLNWDGPDYALGFGGAAQATLTAEHAACSYGLPVVVLRDGSVLGPGDRPGLRLGWGMDVELTDRSADWTGRTRLLRRAHDAGYRISAIID